MHNVGHKIAFASSLLALLLVFSVQTISVPQSSMVASTAQYCSSVINPGTYCPCEDEICIFGHDQTDTTHETICYNEYTDEECECGSATCFENPDQTTQQPEVCYNEFTQDECPCTDTQCLEHNPDDTTTGTTETICYNEYTDKECECGSSACYDDPNNSTADDPVYTEPDYDVYQDCPFTQKTDRIILDFTEGGKIPVRYLAVQANMGIDDSMIGQPAVVPSGVYKVNLASYHQTYDRLSMDANNERWHLVLYDANKTIVLRTEPTRYVGRDEVIVQETVETEAEIHNSTYKVTAKHEAYPNSEPYKFAPLCAAFDFIEPLPVDGTVDTSTDETTTDEPTTDTTTYDEYTETDTTTEDTNPYLNTFMRCPVLKKENRIIVDFTKNGTIPISNLLISTDSTIAPINKGPYATHIPIGEYTVRLSSYGYDLDSTDQNHQEWLVRLLNANRNFVTKTPPTDDIPAYIQSDFTQKVSESLIVKEPVESLFISHNRSGDDDPNTLAVLCATFDYFGDLPKEDDTTQIEQYEPPKEAEEDFTRDIFAPEDKQDDGVFNTSTSIVIPEQEEGEVLAKEGDLGIYEAQQDVYVDEKTIEIRKEIVEEYEKPPFEILLHSTPEEREEIAYKLLHTEADDQQESRQSESSTLLSRVSKEEVTPEIQDERDSDSELAYESFRFKERESLAQNIDDSDGDGVTDYDEVFIYKTNPKDPFTSGSPLTDGERILLGLNPTEDSVEVVEVESPKSMGDVTPNLFDVRDIILVPKEETHDDSEKQIKVAGTAQPLAFVTLYIYSTPIIVTVRTDENGKFEYTLDETLEDGEHEIYVASVNNSGKILAKSEPIPFVKTAEAIDYTPTATTYDADPVDSAMRTAITLLLLLVLMLTISIIVWLGYLKSQHKESVVENTIEHGEE